MTPRGVLVTRRNARTYRPELALAPGPLALAQPGQGTFQELYGAVWALALFRDGPQLLQVEGETWRDQADPEALADLVSARHVALAFDQAARPVLAWEKSGSVYVRQWSASTLEYITRGPWPGCDPLLICDAAVTFDPAHSDVLLLHLDALRVGLVSRVQAENYAVAHRLAEVAPGAVLDQVTAAPYVFTVWGESRRVPLALHSAMYPVSLSDTAAASVGGLGSGEFISLVIKGTASDTTTASVGSLESGEFVSLVITQAVSDTTTASVGGLESGQFIPLVITQSASDTAAASVGSLDAGTFSRVVIVVNLPLDIVQASLSGLSGGSWNA